MEKSAKIFCLNFGQKKNFIMQSGYGEQTSFYKLFSFIIDKISSVQWFHFRKRGFVIFLSGATKTDFFEIGRWKYMTIASKPHIPLVWRIFLRLDSSSSCCVPSKNAQNAQNNLICYKGLSEIDLRHPICPISQKATNYKYPNYLHQKILLCLCRKYFFIATALLWSLPYHIPLTKECDLSADYNWRFYIFISWISDIYVIYLTLVISVLSEFRE